MRLRQERGLGRLREFTQAGVELLGAPSPDGDAEVIALAVESLRAAGVPGTTIRLGHLGLLNDLLQELPEGLQADVRARLYRREFVGIGNAALDGPPARLLRALPELHGLDGLERAREFATSPTSRGALRELEGVAEQLRAYGVADAVEIDLSVIRDFSYYTGIVFEAHGQGAGYPLLGGGRYDTLLARFDADCPATGFALGLERVLAAAPEEPVESRDLILGTDERSRLQACTCSSPNPPTFSHSSSRAPPTPGSWERICCWSSGETSTNWWIWASAPAGVWWPCLPPRRRCGPGRTCSCALPRNIHMSLRNSLTASADRSRSSSCMDPSNWLRGWGWPTACSTWP